MSQTKRRSLFSDPTLGGLSCYKVALSSFTPTAKSFSCFLGRDFYPAVSRAAPLTSFLTPLLLVPIFIWKCDSLSICRRKSFLTLQSVLNEKYQILSFWHTTAVSHLHRESQYLFQICLSCPWQPRQQWHKHTGSSSPFLSNFHTWHL